jgi:hypothetical protein
VSGVSRFERIAIRAGILVGAGLMLVIWVRTDAAFADRQASIRSGAAEVGSRYVQSQESLSTIRTMALLSSVRVRDALLDPRSGDVHEDRRQVDAAYKLVKLLLADYEPVMGEASQRQLLVRLASEIEQLNAAALAVLAEGPVSPVAIRVALNHRIVPRRDAVLEIAEEIQSINRSAFLEQLAEVLAAHEAADAQNRRQVAVAVIFGLITLVPAFVYVRRA